MLELKVLPAFIIFTPYRDSQLGRLKTCGFRWAPSALSSIGVLITTHGPARCTPDGLVTDNDFDVVLIDTAGRMQDNEVGHGSIADPPSQRLTVLLLPASHARPC